MTTEFFSGDTFPLGAFDWNESPDSGNTVLLIVADSNAGLETRAFIVIDTSGIPSDATIDAATFHWYDHSYSDSRFVTDNRQIGIFSGGVSGTIVQMMLDTGTFSTGFKTEVLTSAELLLINQVSTGQTKFRFLVPLPGGSSNRNWGVRAIEHTAGQFGARLEVTYTEASGTVTKVFTSVFG